MLNKRTHEKRLHSWTQASSSNCWRRYQHHEFSHWSWACSFIFLVHAFKTDGFLLKGMHGYFSCCVKIEPKCSKIFFSWRLYNLELKAVGTNCPFVMRYYNIDKHAMKKSIPAEIFSIAGCPFLTTHLLNSFWGKLGLHPLPMYDARKEGDTIIKHIWINRLIGLDWLLPKVCTLRKKWEIK